jgi:hypothetical protein
LHAPIVVQPRGLAWLRSIIGNWLDRTAVEAASACIWISGATEYDDRPGPVRDELVGWVKSWQRELVRAIRQAMETGELRADRGRPDAQRDEILPVEVAQLRGCGRDPFGGVGARHPLPAGGRRGLHRDADRRRRTGG